MKAIIYFIGEDNKEILLDVEPTLARSDGFYIIRKKNDKGGKIIVNEDVVKYILITEDD